MWTGSLVDDSTERALQKQSDLPLAFQCIRTTGSTAKNTTHCMAWHRHGRARHGLVWCGIIRDTDPGNGKRKEPLKKEDRYMSRPDNSNQITSNKLPELVEFDIPS